MKPPNEPWVDVEMKLVCSQQTKVELGKEWKKRGEKKYETWNILFQLWHKKKSYVHIYTCMYVASHDAIERKYCGQRE